MTLVKMPRTIRSQDKMSQDKRSQDKGVRIQNSLDKCPRIRLDIKFHQKGYSETNSYSMAHGPQTLYSYHNHSRIVIPIVRSKLQKRKIRYRPTSFAPTTLSR